MASWKVRSALKKYVRTWNTEKVEVLKRIAPSERRMKKQLRAMCVSQLERRMGHSWSHG